MRGSGLHHIKFSSSLNQGKIPFLYASNILRGFRSPPTATMPSLVADCGEGNL